MRTQVVVVGMEGGGISGEQKLRNYSETESREEAAQDWKGSMLWVLRACRGEIADDGGHIKGDLCQEVVDPRSMRA